MVGAARQRPLMAQKKKTRLSGPARRAKKKRERLTLKIGAAKEKAGAHEVTAAKRVGRAVTKREAHEVWGQRKGERLQRKVAVHGERIQRIATKDTKRIEKREAAGQKISAKDAKKLAKLHEKNAVRLQDAARMTEEASLMSKTFAEQGGQLSGVHERLRSIERSPAVVGNPRVREERRLLREQKTGLEKSMKRNARIIRSLDKGLLKRGFPRGKYYAKIEDLRGHQELSRKTQKALKKSSMSTS